MSLSGGIWVSANRNKMVKEDEIRTIAYRLWEQEGCCDGHDCEHWLKAEVIWKEKQKINVLSIDTNTKSKTVTKPSIKNKSAIKNPARSL